MRDVEVEAIKRQIEAKIPSSLVAGVVEICASLSNCSRFNTRRHEQQRQQRVIHASQDQLVVKRPTVVDTGHRLRHADRRRVVGHRVSASAA